MAATQCSASLWATQAAAMPNYDVTVQENWVTTCVLMHSFHRELFPALLMFDSTASLWNIHRDSHLFTQTVLQESESYGDVFYELVLMQFV